MLLSNARQEIEDLPWFQELFTDSEIKTAKRRLGDADFDIGQFIKTSPTPDWCDE